MRFNIKQESIIRHITDYIRQKQDLKFILTVVAAELRSLIKIDRVKIYKFQSNGSGQVIAESVDNNRLPSVLGLHFPGDEIPPAVRELYVKSRVRGIVNVDTKQINLSALYGLETGEIISEQICSRPVDACHLEYLTAMGVKSSLVLPILYDDQLWGLLACHHSQPRSIAESEMEVVQMVVDQLSIAIAQHTLLTQAPERALRESAINQIATMLHSLPTIEFQSALRQTVTAFSGSGGRLCMKNEVFNLQDGSTKSFLDCLLTSDNLLKIYKDGKQPIMPELAKYQIMEQYSIWQNHYKFGNYNVWAISDIYQIHELRFLQVAFQASKIRSILMIPLQSRQQLLGYLSIFRDEVDTDKVWTGEFDPDQRQLYPRQSFHTWQESKKTQAREWTLEEIELATEVGKQFAFAIQEHELYQQIDKQTVNLQYAKQQQQILLRRIATNMREAIQFPQEGIPPLLE